MSNLEVIDRILDLRARTMAQIMACKDPQQRAELNRDRVALTRAAESLKQHDAKK